MNGSEMPKLLPSKLPLARVAFHADCVFSDGQQAAVAGGAGSDSVGASDSPPSPACTREQDEENSWAQPPCVIR